MKKRNRLVAEEYLEIMDMPVFEEYTFWEQLQKRKIIINHSIESQIVERVMFQIMNFNQADDKAQESIPNYTREPIEIYINTPGGALYETLVLCNMIELSKTPVHTIVLGCAASAGALIAMAGHVRKAYPSSSILIHQASGITSGKVNDMNDELKHINKQSERMKQYIIEHTKITAKSYKNRQSKEWWVSAEEALELGVIDEIIGGKKQP